MSGVLGIEVHEGFHADGTTISVDVWAPVGMSSWEAINKVGTNWPNPSTPDDFRAKVEAIVAEVAADCWPGDEFVRAHAFDRIAELVAEGATA